MTHDAKPDETAAQFLIDLWERLSAQEDIDQELAMVLKTHILAPVIAQDAVAQARSAILRLANRRASPPEADNSDG